MDRTDAQAVHLDPAQSLLWQSPAKPLRQPAANRQQGGDGFSVQTGEGEAKGCERCRVQPLDVVDGHGASSARERMPSFR